MDKTNEERLIEKLIQIYGSSNYSILDNDSGEIIQLSFGSKTKLPSLPVTDKSNREMSKFMPKETFVKLYKRSISELNKFLSYRDFTWFISMGEYLGIRDCILYDDNGKYLNVKKLSKLLDVDYANFCDVFKNTYEKLGLIKRIKAPSQKTVYAKVNAIAVNPYLYMNGEYIVDEIRNEFIGNNWGKLYNE